MFDPEYEFTQDIYSLASDQDGALSVLYKPHSAKTVKFGTLDLEEHAEEIIQKMRQAKAEGMSVMFYSGIVGSIPGETDTAIKIMTTFVEHLKKQQAGTFVINPSEYFEPGMDADDLMYMWEIVQRSGLIDIWRFQTNQDIDRSFALLAKRSAAMGGQGFHLLHRLHQGDEHRPGRAAPEPGNADHRPDPEKFVRRSEYGIGLFHDTRAQRNLRNTRPQKAKARARRAFAVYPLLIHPALFTRSCGHLSAKAGAKLYFHTASFG